MNLGKVISSAITEAVRDARQPPEVAKLLIAWYEALASGKESLDDVEAALRRLDAIFEVAKLEKRRA